MTGRAAFRSTPLDDFLNESSSSTDAGELLQRIGLTGSLIGLTMAIGLAVFLGVVHRGPQREVATLVRITGAIGAVIAIGAAVEIAGVAAIDDLGWVDALTDGSAAAAMMRLLAGLLVLLGLFDDTVPTDPGRLGPLDDDTIVRWVPSAASSFAVVGLAVGAVSFWFDGHTVTEGPRVLHAVVNLVHVIAAGVWFGGLVGLVIIGVARRGRTGATSPLVIRFSGLATVAVIAVFAAGAVMTAMIIDRAADLTATDWGRVLLVKLGAVGIVAVMGAYNHFFVVPRLQADAGGRAAAHARATVQIEAVLLLAVAVLTVALTTASTG